MTHFHISTYNCNGEKTWCVCVCVCVWGGGGGGGNNNNDLTLTVEDQRGLLRVDEGEVDPKLKRVGAIYYKYYSPSFRLKLSVSPVQPRLVVDHQSQLVFRDDQLQLQAVLTYKVDRAGVFDLKFKIPSNLTIENVLCPQMKNFETSSDKTLLTVFLREKPNRKFD